MSSPLPAFRQACLAALDRRHPAFADLHWSLPADQLTAEVARRTRAAIHRTTVEPLQPDVRAPTPNRIARPDETIGAIIERCLAGTWVSVGKAYDFPEGVDYTCSPDPSLNTRGCAYGEWTWQLNRHWEWSLAARLHLGTGEQRYADAVLGWCRRWLEQAPPPRFDDGQPTWRTIEIGLRLANSWNVVLSTLADHFDDELWLAWLGAWALQAPFAWHHRKHNNWLHMEMNGVLHAGIALPFMRDAARWRDQALDALVASFDQQVYPDGMQFELSGGYHAVCIGNLERPVASLRGARPPRPSGCMPPTANWPDPIAAAGPSRTAAGCRPGPWQRCRRTGAKPATTG